MPKAGIEPARYCYHRILSPARLPNENGFLLTGCDGKLRYEQKPLFSHCLNSDFYWYEIGDVIGLGNAEALYYCFPKKKSVVTKARLAAEEIYLLAQDAKRQRT